MPSTPTAIPAAPIAAAGIPAGVAMPDVQRTPGESFLGVTAGQVCTTGWASAHRHVTAAQYHEVYASYDIRYPEPSGTYELDHLIPLELGGDNANANLWPEPASPTPGYHQKDELENALHNLVCSGRLALGTAQHGIAVNWYLAYEKYVTR
ncbi:MAG TPA: HNH endonuclease [Candidatus Dormibacteraeota bacterium]|nr:HNH endonuclease [Candidatus Dormibacteraeota bacterium]